MTFNAKAANTQNLLWCYCTGCVEVSLRVGVSQVSGEWNNPLTASLIGYVVVMLKLNLFNELAGRI